MSGLITCPKCKLLTDANKMSADGQCVYCGMSEDRKKRKASAIARIDEAVELAFRYGGIDGDHHKAWVIDQMLRLLLGDKYDDAVAEANTKDGDPNYYEWNTGIAP